MWWLPNFSKAKRYGLVSCLMLTACGFEPMYGEQSADQHSPVKGNIHIAKVDGPPRYAQLLKNALEDHFNPESSQNADPDYTLTVFLNEYTEPSVVRSDGTILRYDIRFESRYVIADNRHKQAAPITGKVRRISSYNVVPNANYATYVAEQNLSERMVREIADDYAMRITGELTKTAK